MSDVPIRVRIPAPMVADTRALAAENERTLSGELRLALRAWLTANGRRPHGAGAGERVDRDVPGGGRDEP
jgi:hypothetical protein